MKLLKPLLAALLFAALSVYFTYYFAATLLYLGLNPSSELALFVSSPFNMSTEGSLLYNLYIPAGTIFVLGVYLKDFNAAFQRKCNLRAVFVLAVLASYVKSLLSMQYYIGYSDYGISLGTSIITLCFLAAFMISLEVHVADKEKYEHLYGHFILAVISSLIALLAVLTFVSLFFQTSSAVVHLMGLTAFLIMFIPYYERANLARFLRREERAIERLEHRAAGA
jgi:hypothetical protein